MSRPTFTIDRQRLRGLREEAGKTQLTVAKELHAMLGKSHPSTDATLERDYQRIERNGRTSRQRAEALAEIFNVIAHRRWQDERRLFLMATFHTLVHMECQAHAHENAFPEECRGVTAPDTP